MSKLRKEAELMLGKFGIDPVTTQQSALIDKPIVLRSLSQPRPILSNFDSVI